MEPKKKRKRIQRPVQKEEELVNINTGLTRSELTQVVEAVLAYENPEILRIDPQTTEQLALMYQDELLYGISGAHVSETGITRLTIDEILAKYPLTEEQITELKEKTRK